jgi:hypothetical protein
LLSFMLVPVFLQVIHFGCSSLQMWLRGDYIFATVKRVCTELVTRTSLTVFAPSFLIRRVVKRQIHQNVASCLKRRYMDVLCIR